MNGRKFPLVFLCGARDYHAMDWYNRAVENLGYSNISILTDLIESEGFPRIINEKDTVHKMIILDPILFRSQSRLGNIWRNLVKAFIFPLQLLYIKKFAKKNEGVVFYAHSMYYLWLAYFAGVKFVGRPQGSDILIKPFRSRIYRELSIKAIRGAHRIIVDSYRMRDAIKKFSPEASNVVVIMNGIDISTIQALHDQRAVNRNNRNKITSLRGMTPLYRIKEMVVSRKYSGNAESHGVSFIYPYYDMDYKEEVLKYLVTNDLDMGKLDKETFYDALLDTFLSISIPRSDSSPRSVFEAIFCGSAVAVTYNPYYDFFPECMKKRVILVDLTIRDWFQKAVVEAKKIVKSEYVPSQAALELFDQNKTFLRMYECFLTINDNGSEQT